MKKFILSVMACLPLLGMAQNNVWEIPENQTQQTVKESKKALFTRKKAAEDPKYLSGAVPEVNGSVVFTLDKEVPGMSADDIYDNVYRVLQKIVEDTKDAELQPESRIAAVNKGEHTVIARMKEWLVFSNSFLSLDRTEMNYTIIAKATDGHVNVTIDRINYAYEMNRSETQGFRVKAEDWITDSEAINKKGDKLLKASAKFRRKTIDRKDYIFRRISASLGVQ